MSDLRPSADAAAWDRGALATRRDAWTVVASGAAADQLAERARAMVADGQSLASVDGAATEVPALARELAPYDAELGSGSGVVLVRGLRHEGLSNAEQHAQCWLLGRAFGHGVAQNLRGDLLGDVINLSDQQASARPFQNGGGLIMHRDPVDVVGLLCVRHAKAGGTSRIVSAARVHDTLLAERPDLLARLYQGYPYHRLDEDRAEAEELTPYPVPVYARDAAHRVACFFIPGPIERAAKLGRTMDKLGREALDRFVALTADPALTFDMDLVPGDVQLLSNRVVLHGRADYEDHPELERRRYMLRLWLMRPDWPDLASHQRLFDELDHFDRRVPAARA